MANKTITQPATPDAALHDYARRFGISGEANIIDDEHMGIVNGHLTLNVPHSDVLTFRGLYAPPFVSSNFSLTATVCGEAVKTQSYTWLPFRMERRGSVAGVEVASSITLISGERALVLEIEFRNATDATKRVPLQLDILGGLDYATEWNFAQPVGEKACLIEPEGDIVVRRNDTGAVVLGMPGMAREGYVPLWETAFELAPGESTTYYLTLAMGEVDDAKALATDLLQDTGSKLQSTIDTEVQRTAELLGRLPQLSASDRRLEKFYDRSVVHYVLNQWNVEQFILHPYYSTGSVIGGCVCNYLWDFGEGWELTPLLDPAALREHVKAFLHINLMKHFMFNPISGAGWGPWYYINQEKIVFLIYYYVQLTGDKSFLEEEFEGKSILDHVIYHTLYGDRLEAQANLIDYGNGNHHLELRRSYRYDNFLPDMNARRYPIYLAAAELCELAGRPEPVDFRDRAEKLKRLIRKELWSEEHQWWYFRWASGAKELRYTMQLFKLIGSGAISDKEQRGLIEHINETEFLSEYGMHSMSKLDPAYDQIDLDNGGGGAYNSFPPQIAERLYKVGQAEKAEDVLERILWWGERLPYWGDSFAATSIGYRHDTPLQNTLGSVAGAQAIIFGMFGVKVDFDGNITVNPAPPSYSEEIALHGLKIRGKSLDIIVANGQYEVRAGNDVFKSKVGRAITVPAGKSAPTKSASATKKAATGRRTAARGKK